MAQLSDLTLDLYAPLSHKEALGNTGLASSLAPTWIPATEQRRLTAYKIEAAYRSNVARFFLPGDLTRIEALKALQTGQDPEEAERYQDRREYGDARLLIERVVSGVIGEDWQIVVDGADDDLPDVPDLPERPADPPGPDPASPDPAVDAAVAELERRIHEARLTRWTAQATAMVDDWEQAWATQPELQARQDWLRVWADDEFLAGKLQEGEMDSVGLGDGVYALDLDQTAGRVRCTVYDPGFYFPVLTDRTTGYPGKVHVAWEFEAGGDRFVRRLTWELVDLTETLVVFDELAGPGDPGVMLRELDQFERIHPESGAVERLYPWARTSDGTPVNEDDPDAAWSTQTCLFSDGTWPVKTLEARGLDDFSDATVEWAVTEDGQTANRLDLDCDFVPVVHVPNTPATRDHFGESVLLGVAQVLDDLHGSDTDREAARALASLPAVALHGKDSAGATLTVRPGAVFGVGEQGGMDVLDLTGGLEQLRAEGESLLDRMNVNSRVPAEVLGRVKASEVPSGIALALSFGPFRQLVMSLRLTRNQKYPLLLKMVQRLAQVGGWLPPGPNPVARLQFGAYLPSDVKAAVDIVVALLAGHGISRRTALQMLVDVGVDIGDVVDELDRIVAEDVTGALAAAEATQSEQVAADRLGVELPAPASVGPPAVTLPPAPGGNQ